MTDELDLLHSLDDDTLRSLSSTARTYRDKPLLKEEYHVVMESPLLGCVQKSYPDINSLRSEVAKSLPMLNMGKLYIFYGVKLPIFTDSSGANLFLVTTSGEELALTDGYFTRQPVNDSSFGYQPIKINPDDLI
jgi:hypothetical protein